MITPESKRASATGLRLAGLALLIAAIAGHPLSLLWAALFFACARLQDPSSRAGALQTWIGIVCVLVAMAYCLGKDLGERDRAQGSIDCRP